MILGPRSGNLLIESATGNSSPFPVFGGRNEIHGFEAFGEIARRTESYLIGDFGNLHVGTVLEQMDCLAKPASQEYQLKYHKNT